MSDEPIEKLIAAANRAERRKAKEARRVRNQRRMGWVNTLEERRLISQAAEARGMSLSAFCRRAVLSFAYRTLGLDYYEEMRGDAPIRSSMGPQQVVGRDGITRQRMQAVLWDTADGRGCGPWRIVEWDEGDPQ